MTSYSRRTGCVPPVVSLMEQVSPKRPAARTPGICLHEHIVQLFDAPRSLADAVSQFLIEGRALGNKLLVIARASHWTLVEGYLERRGFPVGDPSTPLTV